MPAVPFRTLLARSPAGILIVDGGTGSSLEDRGVDVRTALWSSRALLSREGREATRRLHAEFFDAGAHVVIANTHNVSPSTCSTFLAELAAELPDEVDPTPSGLLSWIEERGVEVAREAVPSGRDVVVAAGIGSEEPWARATKRTRDEIRRALEPCVRALVRDGTGEILPVFETISTLPEVRAVADIARAGFGAVGVGLSCGPDGNTWGGVAMDEVVRAFADADVAAIFVQCTRYDLAARSLERLVAAIEASGIDAVPGVYANDGREWKDSRWHGPRVTPEAYADAAEEWVRLGARLIGGCCGTTVAHVAELSRRLAR